MSAKANLTKHRIDTEPLPMSGRRSFLHDAKVIGLSLQITATGVRSWQVIKWSHGRQYRVTLGRYPDMTIEQARRNAMAALSELSAGKNPTDRKRAKRAELAAPTFAEVLERFLAEKRNRSGKLLADRTRDEYRKIAKNHLGPILSKRLADISVQSLRGIHRSIGSAAAANYARALVSSLWNFAVLEGITALPNPALQLSRRHIESRDRFIKRDEFERFFAAVESSSLRDFFWLALLTGVRRSNLQAMRWQDVDLVDAEWRVPTTKNGTPQNVALVPEAVALLRARLANRVHGEAFVFPGSGATGHLVEPKKAWAGILKRAGLDDLRIHDLRRTLGSWQARKGASLAIIGKSLNHKSPQATAIYARLDLDPVRESVNIATDAMFEAGGIKQRAPVLPLRRKV